MTEEEFLRKLNFINKHNQIVDLKEENKKKDEQIKKISTEGKKLIDEFSQKSQENINALNNRIKELESEITTINQEKNYYKEIVESIPKFILKIFKNNKKAITE